VPTNAVAEIEFSERINPVTVTDNTFFVERTTGGVVKVPGSVVVAADGLSARFTPDDRLATSTSYRVRTFSGITDLAGNTLSSTSVPSSFTTGTEEDVVSPTVAKISPVDGAVGVPVNARVAVQVSEPVRALSVDEGAILVSAGGSPVAGAVSVSSDRTRITFTPTDPLAVSTAHAVTVGGFTDRAGNAVVPFSSSFDTRVSDVADTDRPRVNSVRPGNGDMGVDIDTQIVVTFDEVIDSTTVSSVAVPITVDGFSGQVGGSYAVNGAVVTFTPAGSLPGSALNTNQV